MARIRKTISGLKPDTNYLFTVKPKNAEVVASDTLTETIRVRVPASDSIPSNVTGLVVASNFQTVILKFDPVNDIDIQYYEYQIYDEPTGTSMPLNNIPSPSTGEIISGTHTANVFTVSVSNSTTEENRQYWARVRAINTSGAPSASWSNLVGSGNLDLIEDQFIASLTAAKITSGEIQSATVNMAGANSMIKSTIYDFADASPVGWFIRGDGEFSLGGLGGITYNPGTGVIIGSSVTIDADLEINANEVLINGPVVGQVLRISENLGGGKAGMAVGPGITGATPDNHWYIDGDFRAGGSDKYIYWNPTTEEITVSGEIKTTSGNIGNWLINNQGISYSDSETVYFPLNEVTDTFYSLTEIETPEIVINEETETGFGTSAINMFFSTTSDYGSDVQTKVNLSELYDSALVIKEAETISSFVYEGNDELYNDDLRIENGENVTSYNKINVGSSGIELYSVNYLDEEAVELPFPDDSTLMIISSGIYADSNSENAFQIANGSSGMEIYSAGTMSIYSVDSNVFFQSQVEITGGTDVTATSGGALLINGNLGTQLGIDSNEIQARTNDAASTLNLNNNGGNIVIGNSSSSCTFLGLSLNSSSGQLRLGSNVFWNAGNDGSGSGLDADLLDGIQAASFLRSNVADTATGSITFNGGATFNAAVDFNVTVIANGYFRSSGGGSLSSYSTNAAWSSSDFGGTLGKSTSSSIRYKENITETISLNLDPSKILDLSVVQFNYKPGIIGAGDSIEGRTLIGLLAEDVHEKYPVACLYDEEGRPENFYDKALIPAMIKVIQDLSAKVAELESRLI